MKGPGERNSKKAQRTAVAVNVIIHICDGDVGPIVKPRGMMVQVQLVMWVVMVSVGTIRINRNTRADA
jgi:hypothetical protein